MFLEPFAIQIGDLDEDEATPVCYYEKDAVNLEGQKYICGTPLTGTKLRITQYNQTDSTNLTQINEIDVYYIPGKRNYSLFVCILFFARACARVCSCVYVCVCVCVDRE